MRRLWPVVVRGVGLVTLGPVVVGRGGAEGGALYLVVSDVPHERVWAAALGAVEGYPIERAADGVIVTGRLEREPGEGESGFERVAERIVLRVEAFAPGSTRVTVEAEAEGRREGTWRRLPDAEGPARAVLERLRRRLG